MIHPVSILKRIVERWQHRTTDPRFTEQGDTLVEVLIALVILGIASVALLAGFATSIGASAEHRNLASLDSSTRLAANTAIADIQQQAQATEGQPVNAFACNTQFNPNFSNLGSSFSVSTPTVKYWSGTNWIPGIANCIAGNPQQYTLTVTSTSSASYSSTVTTVISDPSTPTSPGSVGSPSQLQWLIQPGGGTAGTPITPQPEVAVEDSSGNIVQNDFSSVTLQASGPGSLSGTCFGVESYGIVQFSGCSLSASGTYSVQAVDANSSVSATSSVPVTVGAAPAAKVVLTSAVSGTANNKATLGPITVTEQDAFGNAVNATNPVTVTLGSTSTGATFATTSGGSSVGSVTIPANQSSATFYYGDTVAGTPTVTASATGLAPGTQTETITAGTAKQIGFTSSAFTAGASSPAANSAVTVSLEDTYGNATSNTGASIALTLTSNTTGTYIFNTTSGAKTPTGKSTTYSIANGKTSTTVFYGDTATGTPTITAATTSFGSATQQETITAAPTKLVFTTAPVTGNAYTDANIGPITVTEETAANQPATVGQTVNLSSNSSGTYIFNTTQGATAPTGTTSVTIPNGQSSVTFYYGDTDNGTPTITAAATGLASANQIETVNVGPLASYALSTPATNPTAGTSFAETITAQDAGGNTVTSDSGVTCLTFNGPDNSPTGVAPLYPAQGTCPSGSAVTFTNGVATASITPYDAETTTLSATSGFITGTSANFTVNAASAATFTLGTPSPTAGNSFSEFVTAVDTYGNTATSYGGTAGQAKCITFTGPSKAPNNTAPAYPAKGTCTTGSSVTFTSGIGTASMTLYDAQTTTLTATTTATPTITGTSALFTVAAAALSTLTVAGPGAQTAGQQFNVSLTATDTYGNGYTGTLNPTFSGPASSPNGTAPVYPASVSFTSGSGTASVTLYDAQTTTLTATSGISGTSPSFAVNAASSNGFTLSTPSPVAGTQFTETITNGDSYGNALPTPTGSQCVVFAGPTNAPNGTAPAYPAKGTCPTGASAVTFAAGVGHALITLYNAQTTALTATSGTLAGTSPSFSVGSAGAKAFTVTTPAAQTAGVTFSLGINATDTYGNAYSGTVTSGLAFSGPSSSPAPASTPASYPTSVTFANGVGAASITLFDAQTTSITVGATGVTAVTTGSFVVSPSSLSVVNATSGAGQSATIGAAFATHLVATATDGYSNPLSGVSVTFAAPSSGASATFASTCNSNPQAYACTQTTGTNGQATSSTFTANGTAGSYAISGSATGVTPASYSETNDKGTQTITFTSTAPSATVGGANYTAAATGGASGNAVTFSSGSTGICTSTGTNGSVFTFIGVGTCIVDANQAASTNYNAATQVVQNVTVGKGTQTITFTSTAPSATVGGANYTAAATGGASGNTVTFSSGSTGICTSTGTNGSVFTFIGVGTCIVDANQAASTNYNAATQVVQNVTVGKGTQTITFTSTAPSATVGGANYTAAATGGASGNAVTFSSGSTGICTSTGTNGSVFTFIGVGTCIVDANQAASTNYNAATQVVQNVTVAGSPTAVTLASGSGKVSSGDTATITFNDALQPSTVCSAWSGTGSKSLSNATITFTNNGSNDYFTATTASGCTGGGNFGTVYTGASYVSANVTFANSSISFDATDKVLTFTMGPTGTPANKISSGVAAGFPGYTTNGSVTDTSGVPISTALFTSTTKTGF